jgi:predicted DCC family thiol-disulfide oxidoreductase YuxK
MRSLTVLYDDECNLCRRTRWWLEKQPKHLRMEFLPASEAKWRFPQLDAEKVRSDVMVVGDRGEVYCGAKAWLMCLWALREYRSLALSFSTPERMVLARRFVAWVSRNRGWLGFLTG